MKVVKICTGTPCHTLQWSKRCLIKPIPLSMEISKASSLTFKYQRAIFVALVPT